MALRAKSAAIPCWHVGCARGQRWIRSRVRRPSERPFRCFLHYQYRTARDAKAPLAS